MCFRAGKACINPGYSCFMYDTVQTTPYLASKIPLNFQFGALDPDRSFISLSFFSIGSTTLLLDALLTHKTQRNTP